MLEQVAHRPDDLDKRGIRKVNGALEKTRRCRFNSPNLGVEVGKQSTSFLFGLGVVTLGCHWRPPRGLTRGEHDEVGVLEGF
jgi:hypothetical protein